MSNGFEMCDNHTYLFATEGKDCPYCEINRLKLELEEMEIKKAATELTELDVITVYAKARDIAEATLERDRKDWEIIVANLTFQLAEAGAEIERLKVIKWVQTESYEAVAAVEQARQEAAKWVADLLFSPEWEKECHCCEDYYCSICRIKDEFKLEG